MVVRPSLKTLEFHPKKNPPPLPRREQRIIDQRTGEAGRKPLRLSPIMMSGRRPVGIEGGAEAGTRTPMSVRSLRPESGHPWFELRVIFHL
jgi:hypothetical protein